MIKPAIVAHADWSIQSAKRRLAVAVLRPSGRYELTSVQAVGPTALLLRRLRRIGQAAGAVAAPTVLLGVDFPIGLPQRYLEKAGASSFEVLFLRLGVDPAWHHFYSVCETAQQITIERPFYPARPGGTQRQHLLDGLGLTWAELLRQCDSAEHRRDAAALFWTMGAQQVGKAAISGWTDLLFPALHDHGLDCALWPFAGRLDTLLRTHQAVIAETYPAECAYQLGVTLAGSKRTQAARQVAGGELLAWCAAHDVVASSDVELLVQDGFGPSAAGEDSFDAFMGVCGMLNVVMGNRDDVMGAVSAEVLQTEGWILGQQRS